MGVDVGEAQGAGADEGAVEEEDGVEEVVGGEAQEDDGGVEEAEGGEADGVEDGGGEGGGSGAEEVGGDEGGLAVLEWWHGVKCGGGGVQVGGGGGAEEMSSESSVGPGLPVPWHCRCSWHSDVIRVRSGPRCILLRGAPAVGAVFPRLKPASVRGSGDENEMWNGAGWNANVDIVIGVAGEQSEVGQSNEELPANRDDELDNRRSTVPKTRYGILRDLNPCSMGSGTNAEFAIGSGTRQSVSDRRYGHAYQPDLLPTP